MDKAYQATDRPICNKFILSTTKVLPTNCTSKHVRVGSFKWNLGCIADFELHGNEEYGSGMWFAMERPFPLYSPRCTISHTRFWELAIETSYELLTNPEKWWNDLKF
jgi:hypothetical protein